MTGAGTLTLLQQVPPACLMCGGAATTAGAVTVRAAAVDTARMVRGAVRAVQEQREFDREFRRITRADPDLRRLTRRRGGVAGQAAAWAPLPLIMPCYLVSVGYAAWLRAAAMAARLRRRGGQR